MTSAEERREILDFVAEAKRLAVSERTTCLLIGITQRTIQNWRKLGLRDRRKGSARVVAHKLSSDEEERIYQVANSRRFADSTPEQIVAILAQEKTYYASASTFYRILRKREALEHRSESRKPRPGKRPAIIAVTAANQVWAWDITWLKTDVVGLFKYAYTIIDLFDRSIVGWAIEETESDDHASRLFARVTRNLGVYPEIVHADNGNSMRGVTLAVFLDSLKITRSYSRPRCSNDNAYMESWYKTLKYTVGYPRFFTSLEQARMWFADFVNWYNNEHLHSALGYVTPAQRRSGTADLIYAIRNQTLVEAQAKNPLRWRNKKTRSYGSEPVLAVYRPVSQTA